MTNYIVSSERSIGQREVKFFLVLLIILELQLLLLGFVISPLIAVFSVIALWVVLLAILFKISSSEVDFFILFCVLIFVDKGITINIAGLYFVVYDFIYMFIILKWLSQLLYERKIQIYTSPLIYLLLSFLCLCILSALYAMFVRHVSPTTVLRELRPFTYYLIFFYMLSRIRNKEQLIKIFTGFCFLMLIGLLYQYYIFFTGGHIKEFYSGLYRSMEITPLYTALLIVVMLGLFIYTTSLSYRTILIGIIFFATIGFIMSLSRTEIGAFVGALVVMLFYIPRKYRKNGIVLIILFGSLVFVSETLNGGAVFSQLGKRISTVTDEGNISVTQRASEYYFGWQAIKANPLFGIGLGNKFRSFDFLYENKMADTTYIHSGLLFIAVKMGLLTVGLKIILLISFFRKAIVLHKLIENQTLRGMIFGAAFCFVIIGLSSVLQPGFQYPNITPIIAVLFGFVIVVQKIIEDEQKVMPKLKITNVNIY
tara:strand:- start:7430 stop:8875 length:1446 start_codon:yes stop_codon:yes gene_type:complete